MKDVNGREMTVLKFNQEDLDARGGYSAGSRRFVPKKVPR